VHHELLLQHHLLLLVVTCFCKCRWRKLSKALYSPKKGIFDISKVRQGLGIFHKLSIRGRVNTHLHMQRKPTSQGTP
jgi:hypothetical protein